MKGTGLGHERGHAAKGTGGGRSKRSHAPAPRLLHERARRSQARDTSAPGGGGGGGGKPHAAARPAPRLIAGRWAPLGAMSRLGRRRTRRSLLAAGLGLAEEAAEVGAQQLLGDFRGAAGRAVGAAAGVELADGGLPLRLLELLPRELGVVLRVLVVCAAGTVSGARKLGMDGREGAGGSDFS